MRFAIGKERLSVIDNETNRTAIIDNIINGYRELKKKEFDTHKNETNYPLIAVLSNTLKKMSLYDLLCVDVEDADNIVWNECFSNIQQYVNEKVFGAKEFFAIGADASLNGDKYWDEYQHIVNDLLPKDAHSFFVLRRNRSEFYSVVEKIADYIASVTDTKCKWVAFSHDGSYEDGSRSSFEKKEDCYNSMRDAVLSKMKWNTEYAEDFEGEGDAVEYKVWFTQDMIIHESYSGVYVYKIVGENEKVSREDIFTEPFKEWLSKTGFRNLCW